MGCSPLTRPPARLLGVTLPTAQGGERGRVGARCVHSEPRSGPQQSRGCCIPYRMKSCTDLHQGNPTQQKIATAIKS